jgi:hypothetical protein
MSLHSQNSVIRHLLIQAYSDKLHVIASQPMSGCRRDLAAADDCPRRRRRPAEANALPSGDQQWNLRFGRHMHTCARMSTRPPHRPDSRVESATAGRARHSRRNQRECPTSDSRHARNSTADAPWTASWPRGASRPRLAPRDTEVSGVQISIRRASHGARCAVPCLTKVVGKSYPFPRFRPNWQDPRLPPPPSCSRAVPLLYAGALLPPGVARRRLCVSRLQGRSQGDWRRFRCARWRGACYFGG